MNWHERIKAARERGAFTEGDCKLAREWPTCACGEQDPRIPRNKSGSPKDDELSDLGNDFTSAIYWSDFPRARRILAQIERRAAEVLAEVGGAK